MDLIAVEQQETQYIFLDWCLMDLRLDSETMEESVTLEKVLPIKCNPYPLLLLAAIYEAVVSA